MLTRLRTAGSWLRRRAERCGGGADGADVRVVPAADRLSLRVQPAARLDRRGDASCAGCGCVLWGAAFVLSRPGRDPLRHRLRARLAADPAASSPRLPASRSSCSSLISLPATWSYVTFMKRRAHRLPAACASTSCMPIYVMFAVADHRQARRAGLARDPGRAARTRQHVGQHGLSMPSPFTLCIIALVALAVLGLPIGLCDDRRLDPLPAAGRARPRHRRRADPQRPVQQLRAAGRAACSSSPPN